MTYQNDQTTIHAAKGTHVVADFFNCTRLSDNAVVEHTLLEAAKVSKGTVLQHSFHHFDPQGLTGYILLAESHISIHTWPELGYAAVDVFTCGDTMRPEDAARYLQVALGAEKADIKVIHRTGVK